LQIWNYLAVNSSSDREQNAGFYCRQRLRVNRPHARCGNPVNAKSPQLFRQGNALTF
jgi:hypothetical protein